MCRGKWYVSLAVGPQQASRDKAIYEPAALPRLSVKQAFNGQQRGLRSPLGCRKRVGGISIGELAICDEGQLQNRLLTRCPTAQDCLNARHYFAVFVRDLLVPDSLRKFPQLIEAFRASVAVDARISLDERPQIGAAISLFFHCFPTVCCGSVLMQSETARHRPMI